MSLEKEFQYYLDHQAELAEQYEGKILVIKGEQVIGVYDDEDGAYGKSTGALLRAAMGTELSFRPTHLS